MSQVRRISRVFLTRSSPRAPSSSKPGVSMITTGPRGSSSMALRTGSVVVPFTSETTASSWPVTALTRLDFPAFRTPKNPMCVRSPDGVSFRLIFILSDIKSRCHCIKRSPPASLRTRLRRLSALAYRTKNRCTLQTRVQRSCK